MNLAGKSSGIFMYKRLVLAYSTKARLVGVCNEASAEGERFLKKHPATMINTHQRLHFVHFIAFLQEPHWENSKNCTNGGLVRCLTCHDYDRFKLQNGAALSLRGGTKPLSSRESYSNSSRDRIKMFFFGDKSLFVFWIF